MTDKAKEFEITFEGVGKSSGKMRNDVHVTWPAQKETFDIATDEGPFHGGDGTAPPPLALFTAGLTGCLMTQIRAFAKRLKIPVDGVQVHATLRWKGRQVGRDPYETAPVGFHLDVDLNSTASIEDQIRLIDAAKKGCFIEQTLAVANQVGHRLKTSEGWIDV